MRLPLLLLGLALACQNPWREPIQRPTGDAAHALRVGLFYAHRSLGPGYDPPMFLATRDGQILLQIPGEEWGGYLRVSVPPAALDSALTALGVAPALATLDTFTSYAPDSVLTGVLYLLLDTSGGHRLVRLRGALHKTGTPDPRVPDAFRTFFARVQSAGLEAGERWEPDSVVVWLVPPDPASRDFLRATRRRRPGQSPPTTMVVVDWPATLPDTASPRWHRPRNSYGGWRITLSRAELAELGNPPRRPWSRGPEEVLYRLGRREFRLDWRPLFPAEAAWIWVAEEYGW